MDRKDILKELKNREWRLERRGGHSEIWTNGKFKVAVSTTPLNYRAARNLLSQIRRADEAKERGLGLMDDPRLVRGHGVVVECSSSNTSTSMTGGAREVDDEVDDWTQEPWARPFLAAAPAPAPAPRKDISVSEGGTENDKEKRMGLYNGVDPEQPFTAADLGEKIGLSTSGVGMAARAGSVTTSGFRVLKFKAPDDVLESLPTRRSIFVYHGVPPEEADTWRALLEERYGVRDATPSLDEDVPGDVTEQETELSRLREEKETLEREIRAARDELDELRRAARDARDELTRSASSGSEPPGIPPALIELCRELVDVPDERLNGASASVPITTLFKMSRILVRL